MPTQLRHALASSPTYFNDAIEWSTVTFRSAAIAKQQLPLFRKVAPTGICMPRTAAQRDTAPHDRHTHFSTENVGKLVDILRTATLSP
ncbi:MAG: hypothetical protein IH603_01805 [Burkholderia vietnamiensis]|nr:hypothetical protein [Burkholderia vietnamiensis]